MDMEEVSSNEAMTSDSSESVLPLTKRMKLTTEPTLSNTEPTKPKPKGVVKQQNGHYGAQIYAYKRRIWLGTFKTEAEAVAAYDSASMKLHGGAAQVHGGAYHHQETNNCSTRTQLFQKELTPSDVGKLNRLVIPKKYAVKYMPFISDEQSEKEGVEDVEVVFKDIAKRQWKFRYCYWRSSQSFVFTRGWNGFVKEKNLKAKDIIVFYTCNDSGESKNYLMIDVQGSTSDEVPEEVNKTVQGSTSDEEVTTKNLSSPKLEDKGNKSEENNKGGFKLFGVMIRP